MPALLAGATIAVGFKMPDLGMTDEKKIHGPKSSKCWLWIGAGLTIAMALGTAVFLQSAFFREVLRQRLVAGLEQATGARVELKQFSFDLKRLQVDLRGPTIHGLEGPADPPLFSSELVQAGWKILSFWRV